MLFPLIVGAHGSSPWILGAFGKGRDRLMGRRNSRTSPALPMTSTSKHLSHKNARCEVSPTAASTPWLNAVHLAALATRQESLAFLSLPCITFQKHLHGREAGHSGQRGLVLCLARRNFRTDFLIFTFLLQKWWSLDSPVFTFSLWIQACLLVRCQEPAGWGGQTWWEVQKVAGYHPAGSTNCHCCESQTRVSSWGIVNVLDIPPLDSHKVTHL